MKRILVTGAGGAPALNFTRSLRAAPERMSLIGVDCHPYYLERAECDQRFLVPRADHPGYIAALNQIARRTGAEFIHAQNDQEIRVLSERRDQLALSHFFPSRETVSLCLDKLQSHRKWQAAGLPQPATMLLRSAADLKKAFRTLGKQVWVRDIVGAAGKGSLLATGFAVAKAWLDHRKAWGGCTAAAYLSPRSVTWSSIWFEGRLVVAQSRKRLFWEFADRAPSGVTGLTGAGLTIRSRVCDDISRKAIRAIDPRPHGIYGVDLTYDEAGVPNPTEINIARFFTTHQFFTRAGLNLPYIYLKYGYREPVRLPRRRVNPLPADLLWIRGMDKEPILTTAAKVKAHQDRLDARMKRLTSWGRRVGRRPAG